jgi:hypothetical protein
MEGVKKKCARGVRGPAKGVGWASYGPNGRSVVARERDRMGRNGEQGNLGCGIDLEIWFKNPNPRFKTFQMTFELKIKTRLKLNQVWIFSKK